MRFRRLLLRSLPLLGLLATFSSDVWAEDCLTAGCHAQIDGLKNRHAPVVEGECEVCHRQLPGEHPVKGQVRFELVASGMDLCTPCHESLGNGKIVHAPVSEGDCLVCHNPHGGDGSLQRVAGKQATLCQECHDNDAFQQKYLHGPVAAGDCTACHDPHRAPTAALLKKPLRDLCLGCHTAFQNLEEAPFSHPPVRDDACTVCHDPHGAPTKYLLASGQPGICIECHPQLGEIMKTSTTLHAPLSGAESCGGCHSTHFSEHRGLLPQAQEALCLSCHGRNKSGQSGAKSNVADELANKKFLHGPISQGECVACHDPHGASTFRLLSAPYPDGFYAPYKPGLYDFCLQCHEKNLLRFPDTTIYTNFRNGNQNLHYVHVADSRKGRTCRACHQAHASNLPKLISEKGSSFGDWQIPLGFTMSETGGSCSPGCHRTLAYDREQPADYEQNR